jgi:hypothetical protein
MLSSRNWSGEMVGTSKNGIELSRTLPRTAGIAKRGSASVALHMLIWRRLNRTPVCPADAKGCDGVDRRSLLSLVAGGVAMTSVAHAVSRPPVALRRLRLVNAHTGEIFDGAYRDDRGPIEAVVNELCVVLRDHHSGEKTQMDWQSDEARWDQPNACWWIMAAAYRDTAAHVAAPACPSRVSRPYRWFPPQPVTVYRVRPPNPER